VQSGGGVTPGAMPANKQHVDIGGRAYVFDPTTGTYTDTGLGYVKPDMIERNGQTYQYEPTSDSWKLVSGLPTDQSALPKAQLILSQQYDSLNYIHQQLAQGHLSPAEASAYYSSVRQQSAAALAGTTPYAIYKQQQDFENQQATNAKALLDTQVTASNSLVDNLLKGLQPSSKVPPLVASSVPFDINPVLDVAQGQMQRYLPADLTDSAQQLLRTFYGPQPPAPGQTDGAGMPMHPADISNLPIVGPDGQPVPPPQAAPPPANPPGTGPEDNTFAQQAA